MKYLFSVLLWMLWCTLHSALITETVTDYMKTKLGDRYRFYRLSYNLFALLTFLPLVLFSISIRGTPIFRWEGLLAIVKYLILAISIFLFIAGGRHYRISQFLGIDQIETGFASHVLSHGNTFETTGILNVIRHPWYAAGILIVWARDITLSILLINIVITAYFVVGSFLEERKLVREFGNTYREYQRYVSMLFPYKWLRGRIVGMP
jgi:protein-S-isoprenylcysteine O-methyltransferase Ste14